jgi:flagellar protein FlgJ
MNISSMSNNAMQQALFNASAGRIQATNININELSREDADLLAAAQEFEAFFLNMLLRSMRNTVNTEGGILPLSTAERTFREMQDEQTTRQMAAAGGVGFAQMMFRQMTAHRNPIREDYTNHALYGAYGAAVKAPANL